MASLILAGNTSGSITIHSSAIVLEKQRLRDITKLVDIANTVEKLKILKVK